MYFNLIIGDRKIPDGYKITQRTAVRTVVIKEGKILLIRTNKGDYKFVGGGIENGESIEDALKRETKEEAGYEVVNIQKNIGEVLENRIDIFDDTKYFTMKSIYIQCEIDVSKKTEQNLDEYEYELGYEPVFVDILTAIISNEKLLKEGFLNDCINRETEVLKMLLKMNN